MFGHRSSTLFTAADVLSKNTGNEDSGRFSILGSLDSFKTEDGKFHFMLCYPDLTFGNDGKYCNEWKQTSNPASSTSIQGYEEISIAFPWNGGKGLALSSTSDHCFIDNSPNSGNWWWCVGAFAYHGSTGYWPGPEPHIVNKVHLYVNVDHLTQ